jgi:integrase/recombinase XerD
MSYVESRSPIQRGPAPPKQPGPWQQEASPDAAETLLTPQALAFVAHVRRLQREAMKDKTYRATPIGGEVGRFLRAKRWENSAENTLLSYESTLAKLSLDFADKDLVDLTREDYREFLDERWGESEPSTRGQRLACLKSFLEWAVDENRLPENPMAREKPPKKKDVNRRAYGADIIDELRDAQESLRDQIAIQLLGRLGLRRSELRVLQLRDINIAEGLVRVRGKGGKVADLPIAFDVLLSDLELYLIGRGGDEYLLYPKDDVSRPMTAAGVHYWFKRCLRRADMPASMMLHEMRHSAADNLWRDTGNLMLAKQLLRHSSVGTTEAYLHPRMDDLKEAMKSMERHERERRN